MANTWSRSNKVSLPLTDDFRSIVLENRPLIDVRAPVEFEKGAFPTSVNLPLMNDEERRLVGIRYKNEGNEAAVRLGNKLVEGDLKRERIDAWKDFIQKHPDAYLYCFRGGQRSGISQQWLADEGVEITRLKGGYKAFRNFLTTEAEAVMERTHTLIIGGRTGSGKTLLLPSLDNAIDLEGLANHRGSSFGRYITPQPSQIDFEDALAYQLIQFDAQNHKNLVIEHESHNIGRVHIPNPIYNSFEKGELIILETDIQKRTEITHYEYVEEALRNYEKSFAEAGAQKWADDINGAFDRIKRRLGSERYLHLKQVFADAFEQQKLHGDLEAHKVWVESLLTDYYDPMYDYQIEKSPIPVVFRGNDKEVIEYIKSREV